MATPHESVCISAHLALRLAVNLDRMITEVDDTRNTLHHLINNPGLVNNLDLPLTKQRLEEISGEMFNMLADFKDQAWESFAVGGDENG